MNLGSLCADPFKMIVKEGVLRDGVLAAGALQVSRWVRMGG